MIIATNRAYRPHLLFNDWKDYPEADEIVHFACHDQTKSFIESQPSNDSSIPIKVVTEIQKSLAAASRKEILCFVTGGRKLDFSDFLDFEKKLHKAGFDGVLVGFSPPFSWGLKAYNNPVEQFEKSHKSCSALTEMLLELAKLKCDLSLLLQSAGNDFGARALALPLANNLPRMKSIIATASVNQSSSYLKSKTGTPVSRGADLPVSNSNDTLSKCNHFTSYFRDDDFVLKILKQPPAPLFGHKPNKDKTLYAKNVSLIDCSNVHEPILGTHTCYESNPTIIKDILEVFCGRMGDQELS